MGSLIQMCISLTKDDREAIKRNAKAKGYRSASAYLVALGRQVPTELGDVDSLMEQEAKGPLGYIRTPYSAKVPDRFTVPETSLLLATKKLKAMHDEEVEDDRKVMRKVQTKPEHRWLYGRALYYMSKSGPNKFAQKVQELSPVVVFALWHLPQDPLEGMSKVVKAYLGAQSYPEYQTLEQRFLDKYGYPWHEGTMPINKLVDKGLYNDLAVLWDAISSGALKTDFLDELGGSLVSAR